MRITILTGITAAIAFCASASADVPKVATDIAPVHSLVTRVMGELGQPDLILPQGASPHGYSLRPSEARSLAQADIVFWIGGSLTPWLADALGTLSGNAKVVELLDAPEATILPFRQKADFDAHEGGDEHHEAAHDDHGHEVKDDQARDHHTETKHANVDAHDNDEGHDHDGDDPHAWMDTQNAVAWTMLIAEELSEADPENAAQYKANADAAIVEIEALSAEISARLEPIHGLRYVVFHDAYQYFERRFDVPSLGAISLGDATDPGAARVAEVRDLVRESEVSCIAAEPQFNPALARTVADGSDIRTTVLDPMGAGLEPGVSFYPALISGLADSLLACQ